MAYSVSGFDSESVSFLICQVISIKYAFENVYVRWQKSKFKIKTLWYANILKTFHPLWSAVLERADNSEFLMPS